MKRGRREVEKVIWGMESLISDLPPFLISPSLISVLSFSCLSASDLMTHKMCDMFSPHL